MINKMETEAGKTAIQPVDHTKTKLIDFKKHCILCHLITHGLDRSLKCNL